MQWLDGNSWCLHWIWLQVSTCFPRKYLRNETNFAADVKPQALPPHLPLIVKETTISQWSQQKTCPGIGNNERIGCKNKFGTKQHKSYLLLTWDFGIQGYTHRMMLHCISGGGKDKTLGAKGWGASGTSVVLHFFTPILPTVLQAAGTSLISATATRNQVYLSLQQHPECLLFTLSRIWNWFPWPERAWVYGHKKLEFFLQSNTAQCWATAIVLLLGKLFMSPKQDAHVSMTLLFAPVLMATHTKVAPNQKNSPCFKNTKTHKAQTCPLFPACSFALWKPLQDNFRCIVCKTSVWQAMTHTFLWNPPKRELGHTSLRTSTHLPGPTDWGSSAILPLFKYGPEKQRWLM